MLNASLLDGVQGRGLVACSAITSTSLTVKPIYQGDEYKLEAQRTSVLTLQLLFPTTPFC